MPVACSDCILFVDDFTLRKVPSSNGKKFYISSPRSAQQNAARGSLSNLTSVGLEEKQRTRDRLRKLMKELVIGETKPKLVDLNFAFVVLIICIISNINRVN